MGVARACLVLIVFLAALPGWAGQQKQKPADPAKAEQQENGANNQASAEKDIEVAEHYMHIGDYDAAIDRLEDAIDSKPGYAIPFRYLGEAQEKKGLKKQAVKSYQRYLDLYPHAEDAAKIKKKIEKLYKEVAKEKKN